MSQDGIAIRLLCKGSTEKEAFMNNNSSSPSVDSAVVGAGMAGLAAAAYVARAGEQPRQAPALDIDMTAVLLCQAKA